MKRRILLLAGILALGATSFAAEGTRDFLDNFKDVIAPNEEMTGYWNQDFTGYTDSEGKNDKYMRLQNSIGLNLTEKFSMALRTRSYLAFPSHSSQGGNDNFRIDAKYNSGEIFGSKLEFSQRLRFYRSGGGEGAYSYTPQIDFGGYLGEKGWGIANLEYFYGRSVGGTDEQALKYDIDFGWDLGYGFSNEIEFFGAKNLTEGDADFHSLFLALYFDHTLWTSVNESTTFDFHTEISATPVKINTGSGKKDKTKFDAFDSETFVKLNKTWHDNFSTYLQAGVTTSRNLTSSKLYEDNDPTKEIVYRSSQNGVNLQGYGRIGFSYSF